MNEVARLVAPAEPDLPTEMLLCLLPAGLYACDAEGRIIA
jgi:hypothetical protein